MSLDDAIKKAVGVNTQKQLVTGDVGDFIPVEYAEEFIDLIREKNYCRQIFRSINMPSQKFEIPKITADASVYYVSSEATAPAAQSKPTFAGTGTVELSAKKLMAYVDIASEVEEDSKIAMLPLIKESFAEGMAAAEEAAMIQGNDAWAWTNAEDSRRAFDGIIHLGTVTAVNAAAHGQDLIKAIELARYGLGKNGRNVRDLILLVNTFTASLLRRLTQVLTIDKYGPKATILAGELGMIMGIKIIESPYVPEDPTDKDTVEDFATNGVATKGLAVLMRRDAVLIGDRRKVKFDQDKIVEKDAVRVVISERLDFVALRADAICNITELTNSKG